MTPTDQRHQQSDENLAGAWRADLRMAFSFFTRMPLPGPADHAAPDFSRAARAVPIAGLAIGLVAGLVLWVLAMVGLSPLVSALIAVLTATTLSGGLHEDGLADTADGLGAFDRARRLDIMRDSRIGAYGVIALIGAIGLKAALLAQLVGEGSALTAAAALIAAEATSRITALMPLYRLPPARDDGLAHASGRPETPAFAQGWGVAALITLALGAVSVGLLASMVGLVLCFAAGLAVTRLAAHMLGGHTGDIAGAAQQIGLLAMLAGLAAMNAA